MEYRTYFCQVKIKRAAVLSRHYPLQTLNSEAKPIDSMQHWFFGKLARLVNPNFFPPQHPPPREAGH